MFYLTFLLFLPIVWACIHVLSPFRQKNSGKPSLPPGPKPFPIVGNLLKLGNQPLKSLADLSKIYGPIMFLKLGSIPTIVISSSKTAQLVLQKNGEAFSNRKTRDAVRALDHHQHSVVWLPCDPHWRNLRKIGNNQMFTVQQLNSSLALRQKKVEELLDHAYQSCKSGEAVDIGGAAFTTSLNFLSNTIFSTDLAPHGCTWSQEIKDTVWRVMEQVGKPNIADYFPALRSIDPHGIRRTTEIYFSKLIEIFDGIIAQRSQSTSNDVLDVLLNLIKKKNSELTCEYMKHMLLDLFMAGTHTTSSTIEWAMTELLHKPETMVKARSELEEVLGKGTRVQESDISKLPYLQAVIKETFRLHPPVPLIIREEAGMNSEICGYTIPKSAQVLVNVWAIGRDPTTWSAPNEFAPERFLGSEIDVKGQDFELIPFGAGRRICLGLPLAHRMVHLMLASLLHSFDWKLQGDMKPEEMDMSQKFGVSLQKAQPLLAIPIKV